jgi:CheY-like chemotaxis protein
MNSPKILIIEDQSATLEALENAVNTVIPKFKPDYQIRQYDVARCYNDAESKINQNQYDLILLDHRLPMNDMGNLEDTDFDAFCDSLENLGYRLILKIKEKSPDCVVIGTSSLSKGELRGMLSPDFKMSKMWGDAEADLENILRQVKGGDN